MGVFLSVQYQVIYIISISHNIALKIFLLLYIASAECKLVFCLLWTLIGSQGHEKIIKFDDCDYCQSVTEVAAWAVVLKKGPSEGS